MEWQANAGEKPYTMCCQSLSHVSWWENLTVVFVRAAKIHDDGAIMPRYAGCYFRTVSTRTEGAATARPKSAANASKVSYPCSRLAHGTVAI